MNTNETHTKIETDSNLNTSTASMNTNETHTKIETDSLEAYGEVIYVSDRESASRHFVRPSERSQNEQKHMVKLSMFRIVKVRADISFGPLNDLKTNKTK
ncbi:hypothetical protein QE152_g5012 [Popillia japonica]|uniref:Uncharacterized protein n=1 Tax=Popillia japonica TaxID=7064 RepID=A0AAW1MYB9_POPJA